jgi:hypothetical protein
MTFDIKVGDIVVLDIGFDVLCKGKVMRLPTDKTNYMDGFYGVDYKYGRTWIAAADIVLSKETLRKKKLKQFLKDDHGV